MKTQNILSMAVICLMLVFAGCNQPQNSDNNMDEDSKAMNSDNEMQSGGNSYDDENDDDMDDDIAIAAVQGTQGNDVQGTITFEGDHGGVSVHADISGLPQGEHGYHIHLYGDCSADDGTSAGTHFNFDGSSKNPPSDIDRITGNLGNLTAGNGATTADTTISNTSIDNIMGRAVIIHAKGNDPSQPPIGAAGARLACGVIGHANPESMMMNDTMHNDQMNDNNMENDEMNQ